MIVVVGAPAWRSSSPAGPAGHACAIALVAAASGSQVELVGRIGDDRPGDELVLALSRAGVGHAAVLRDPYRSTPDIGSGADGDDGDPAAGQDPDAEPTHGPPAGDGPVLQPEDVRLGLSYLGSYSVLVVADDVSPAVLPACLDGAAFAGARLVILLPDGAPVPDGVPSEATVLGVPRGAAEQGLGGLVGTYAAGLDRGHDPGTAFESALGEAGPTAMPG
jgi:hypothetical protein